ncbi:MAG: hypothetical protein ED559_11355 [Phycisphaera sp.]|nr:MAG: hypothetical protein ED559_11355 [Phycisphaera sp.]
MRLLIAINRICYGACLLAIVCGSFITVAAIWMEQHAVGWKGISTAVVLIFAAVLVLAINSIIGLRVVKDNGGLLDFLPGKNRDDVLNTAGGTSVQKYLAKRHEGQQANDESESV